MENIFRTITIVSATLMIFTGCASNLPLTPIINESIINGITVNTLDSIIFEYESKISDGLIKPFMYVEDNRSVKGFEGYKNSDHLGYYHSESATLRRMLKEYLSNKFSNLNTGSDMKIKVTFTDFQIEQRRRIRPVIAFIGVANVVCIAEIEIFLTVIRGEEKLTKVLSVTSEERAKNVKFADFRSMDKPVLRAHGININRINNELLILINSYLEEIGL